VYFSEEDTFQPDIIFISKEKSNIIGEVKIEGVPDLIIEILSPSTAYYDLGRKYKVYEKAGVREYWLIHPDRKRIEIYINKDERFQLLKAVEETGIIKSELLKDFEVELTKVF
jgi:Uma2 family endonuclease